VSRTVPGNALSEGCPGTWHRPAARRHCEGKHCLEAQAGLLVLRWEAGSLLTLADVLAAYAAIRDLSEGYLLPIVVHLQGLSGIAVDARSLLLEGTLTSRIGFVGTGPVDRVLAAFLEPALCESRYFDHPEAAHTWALAVSTGN
jgi:hypothetical protein